MAQEDTDDAEGLTRLVRAELKRRGKSDDKINKVIEEKLEAEDGPPSPEGDQ